MALSNLNLLQTLALIPLLSSLILSVHSQDITSFSFDAFDPNPKGLTYEGSAHVPAGSNILRLNKIDETGKPTRWDAGRVVYSKPVHFWQRSTGKKPTFQATISFVITPSTSGAADGIVFFIAPVGDPVRGAGASFGVFNSSGYADSLFAVEFDTFINAFDPNYRHIGIDINSRVSDEVVSFDAATGDLVTVFISYEPNTQSIFVAASAGSQYATVTTNFDLSTILPEWVQVGLSAATGEYVNQLGVHDIHSWYFTSTLVPDGGDTKEVVARTRKHAPL